MPQLQRRTLRVLAVAQVFGGAGFFLGIAVSALLARDITGEDSLGGVPLAFGIAAGAVAAAPKSVAPAEVAPPAPSGRTRTT